MRNLIARSVIALLATFMCSSMVMAQGGAGLQNTLYEKLRKDPVAGAPGGPAPKRDLNGAWAGPLVPKAGEIPPLTPLGQKLMNVNKPESKFGTARSNDPLNTCDPLGFPRNLVFETRGLGFATMPGKVVLLDQYQKIWRDVWMDGRELPKNVDAKGGPPSTWYGYSVGHWDGDYTLVIDTTGSDDRSWLNTQGYPHSVDAHVQERYTRVDHNHMEVTVTMDDPKVYTKPFTLVTSGYMWIPSQQPEEQMCVPSEAISYRQTIALPAAGDSATAQ